MATIPNPFISLTPTPADLKSIQVIDFVGPTAANRQPNQIDERLDEKRDRLSKLIADMNALGGRDDDGEALYVDEGPLFIDRTGEFPMLANMSMGGNRITDGAAGVSANDFVTKAQLDGIEFPDLSPYVVRTGDQMTGNLTMSNASLVIAGSGQINMGNRRILNLGNGSGSTDAVNKNQLMRFTWLTSPVTVYSEEANQIDATSFATFDATAHVDSTAVAVIVDGEVSLSRPDGAVPNSGFQVRVSASHAAMWVVAARASGSSDRTGGGSQAICGLSGQSFEWRITHELQGSSGVPAIAHLRIVGYISVG